MKSRFNNLLITFIILLVIIVSGCVQSQKPTEKLKIDANNIEVLSKDWTGSSQKTGDAKVTFAVNTAGEFKEVKCYLDAIDPRGNKLAGEQHEVAKHISVPGTYVVSRSPLPPDDYYYLEICCGSATSDDAAYAFCKQAGSVNSR